MQQTWHQGIYVIQNKTAEAAIRVSPHISSCIAHPSSLTNDEIILSWSFLVETNE